MTTEGLSIDRIVDVQISVSPLALQRAGFGLLNIVGISDVIPINERFRTYESLAEIAADFETTDEEYLAATIFYSQVPRPVSLMISRRANADLPAELLGGNNAETTVATWAAISDGAFDVDIDGVEENVTACDFSAATTMENVATEIDSNFTGTCVWDGSRFVLKTASTGSAALITVASTPGAGTDISALMDADTGNGRAYDGTDTETVTESLDAIEAKENSFYGIAFTAETRDNTDVLLIAAWAEARTKYFVNGISDNDAKDASITNDTGSLLQDAGYSRTESAYNETSDYLAISSFARLATVNYDGTNTTITKKFKQMPGITVSTLNSGEANALEGKDINYYTYFAGQAMYSRGRVANGRASDEIVGIDWLHNAIQTDVFNVLYTSTTKVPYTNAGMALLASAVDGALEDGVRNGLLAPGFVTVDNEQIYLEKGYQVQAGLVEDASAGDRDDRIAPPISFIAKGAGAIEQITIIGTFVR